MIKIKLIKTGEIKEVYKNDAHALIEKGEAILYKEEGYTTKPYFAKNKVKYGYLKK